jgi:aquaporin Z
VNPARSTGPAMFAGAEPLGQLWAFWVAPLVGALVAGAVYRAVFARGLPAVPLEVASKA